MSDKNQGDFLTHTVVLTVTVTVTSVMTVIVTMTVTVTVKRLKKVKGVSQLRRDITCHMGSHSVTCHPTQKCTRPALRPASKPVLDLPTPKGWKAELT